MLHTMWVLYVPEVLVGFGQYDMWVVLTLLQSSGLPSGWSKHSRNVCLAVSSALPQPHKGGGRLPLLCRYAANTP